MQTSFKLNLDYNTYAGTVVLQNQTMNQLTTEISKSLGLSTSQFTITSLTNGSVIANITFNNNSLYNNFVSLINNNNSTLYQQPLLKNIDKNYVPSVFLPPPVSGPGLAIPPPPTPNISPIVDVIGPASTVPSSSQIGSAVPSSSLIGPAAVFPQSTNNELKSPPNIVNEINIVNETKDTSSMMMYIYIIFGMINVIIIMYLIKTFIFDKNSVNK